MRKAVVAVLVVLAVSFVPVTGYAASPWTQETTYQDKMMGKLGFGLKNTLLGWTEIIKAPVRHYRDAESMKIGHGIVGIGDGLVHGVIYTVGGVLHLVTFPITQLDVPLPDDGVKGCPLKG